VGLLTNHSENFKRFLSLPDQLGCNAMRSLPRSNRSHLQEPNTTMARHPGAEAVYECADLFRQRCLIEGRSLLWPDQQIWNDSNLASLERATVDRPIEGTSSFIKKWKMQLADQPDNVVRVAADLMMIFCLMPGERGAGAAKRHELIQSVLNWRPTLLTIADTEQELMSGAIDNGIELVGTYTQDIRHRELEFLVKFSRAVVREHLDPFSLDTCKALAARLRQSMNINTRSSIFLIHLLFPDRIEAIASHEHRAKIVSAFSSYTAGIDDKDDQLYEIRRQLSRAGEEPTFHFYRSDVRPVWHPVPILPGELDAGTSLPAPPDRPLRTVKISPGPNAQEWSDCVKGGYICVGWDKVGDLKAYASKERFVEAFRVGYNLDYNGSRSKLNEKANELWTLMELRTGDRVVANRGASEVLGVGTVVEPGYRWLPERRDYRHTVAVDWDTSIAGFVPEQIGWTSKTIDTVSTELSRRISELQASSPDSMNDPLAEPVTYIEPQIPSILEAVRADGLQIDDRTLRRYHLSLKTRGFVVLSGLSGTGKTWLAERYAAAVGARHLIVSVAPNWTTNEDLLGYASPLTERYHDTAFSRFLRAAADEYKRATDNQVQPQPYHVVLDEMNLARVEYYFAKFLSAMEVRMRYGTAEIELGPDDIVTLTPNLFVIGTVNIDETTHGFADKVYDRAQLIELEARRDDIVAHLGDAIYAEELLLVWDYVRLSGPFTFRVLDEIATYVKHAEALDVPWQESLDEQLLQKVLPKLKGADLAVGNTLGKLAEWSQDRFPLTYARATLMLQRLHEHGFTSYH
jgi:MoxR-like ATPase